MHFDEDPLRLDSRDIELNPDALIERKGPVQYIYGRWDRIFGAWRVRGDGVVNSYTPSFPLLLPCGEPEGLPGWVNAKTEPDIEWDEPWGWDNGEDHSFTLFNIGNTSDREVLKQFTRLIPSGVRALLGNIRNSKNQWRAASAICRDPTLFALLSHEIHAVGTGYVEFCLSQSDTSASAPSACADFLRRALTHPRRALLSELVGVHVPNAIVSVVSRLRETEFLTQETAEAIRTISEIPDAMRLLGNCETVSCAGLLLFANSPQEFRHAKFFREKIARRTRELDSGNAAGQCHELDFDPDLEDLQYADDASDQPNLGTAAIIYRRILDNQARLPEKWRQTLHARIGIASSSYDLLDAVSHFLAKHVGFDVPWPGDAQFVPVRTRTELRRAALLYRNCAEGRISELLGGHAAMYLASTPWPAMIEVRPLTAHRSWRISDFQLLDKFGDTANLKAVLLGSFAKVFRDATGAGLADAQRWRRDVADDLDPPRLPKIDFG